MSTKLKKKSRSRKKTFRGRVRRKSRRPSKSRRIVKPPPQEILGVKVSEMLIDYNTAPLEKFRNRDNLGQALADIERWKKTNWRIAALMKNALTVCTKLKSTPCPVFDYLSGPGYVGLFTGGLDDKIIYLVGEEHGTLQCTQKSVDIVSFYDKLFSTTDRLIDFYLEAPNDQGATTKTYIKSLEKRQKEPRRETKFINQLRDFARKCTGNDKRFCNFPIRAHYIDIRQLTEGPDRILEEEEKIFQWMYWKIKTTEDEYSVVKLMAGQQSQNTTNASPDNDRDKFLLKHLGRIQELFSGNMEEFSEKIFRKTILDRRILKKQRAKAPEDIVEIVEQWAWDQYKLALAKIEKNLEKDIKFREKLIPFGGDISAENWSQRQIDRYKFAEYYAKYYYFDKIFLLSMDVYAMFRVFKTFDVKKGRDSNFPKKANYVIMHAGLHHVSNYKAVLQKLNYSEVFESGEKYLVGKHSIYMSYEGGEIEEDIEDVGCTDLREFPQPFFRDVTGKLMYNERKILYSTEIPRLVLPGEEFQVVVENKEVNLVCPEDKLGGDVMEFLA